MLGRRNLQILRLFLYLSVKILGLINETRSRMKSLSLSLFASFLLSFHSSAISFRFEPTWNSDSVAQLKLLGEKKKKKKNEKEIRDFLPCAKIAKIIVSRDTRFNLFV